MAALLAALPAAADPAPAGADTGAFAAAGRGDLIRCPDWEALAPPVVRAAGRDARTDARIFGARAARSGSRTADAPSVSVPRVPSPLPSSCGHTVAAGDTLGGIAAARLGAAARWREIAAANPGADPLRLRIGSTLRVPCGAAGAGEGGAGVPPARVADPDPGAPPPGPESSGSPPDAAPGDGPALPPPPLWTAARGEFLADVLTRWGAAAGWTVIVDTTDAWRLAVAFRTRSAFDAAVAELVRGLGHDGVPPRVRLYRNRVLRLGGPL